MTQILIVQGNTPDMVARGQCAATPFVATLNGLAPDVQTRIAAPYEGAIPAQDLDGVDGVIFTGAGVAWCVDAPEGAAQVRAMETVFHAGLPTWGSCNGMQLAAHVLGGKCGASPKGFEVGVAQDLTLTDAGTRHAMCAGRSDGWAVPCIHRDEVQALPKGAELLVTNAHSPNQGFAYARNGVDFWGVQYHPELTVGRIADYMRGGGGLFGSRAHMIPDLDAAMTDADAAARIGTTPAALKPEVRAMELLNWVAHVRG